MNNSRALLHLSLIEGIGPVTIKTLIASGVQPADLYACSSRDLVERCGLAVSSAQKIVAGLSSYQDLDREMRLLEQYGVQWTTLGSSDYPELLAAIHAPPVVVYWRGANLFHEPKMMAFVGSRKAHRYAEQVIDALVPDLVTQGWVIVSGGAIGADSMAHRAAVRAGGRTMAIVGSGLINPYPASNRRLFEDIVAQGGALVSCFPLETEAMPGLFPARNRIIAGISRGCVVVQAAAQSGALITAHLALEQGRDVFAVPGLIGDELSAGCHELIKQGAKLTSHSDDILSEFAWLGVHTQVVSPQKTPQEGYIAPAQQAFLPEHRFRQECVAGSSTQPLVASDSLEGIVLNACVRPISTDDVALLVHKDIDAVQGLLFELQLEGKVTQNFAGLWERL